MTDFSGFHQFTTDEGEVYGSFEVFECDDSLLCGWFWHACFPGCLPDGEPMGPFDTAREAYDDAQS